MALGPRSRETLLRVAQEALANAARHARARRLDVDLVTAGRVVELRVADDGRGLVPGAEGRGLGLRLARERLGELGGAAAAGERAGPGHPSHRDPADGRPMTAVLIVDDHPVVRQGLRFLLEQQPGLTVAGEAADGAAAARLAGELSPDVVLLDLVMPGEDGAEVVRRIRRRAPRAGIVVLTSYHSDELISRTLRAGALSYMLKETEPADLVRAVRAAARGESVLHPHVAARVLSDLRGEAPDDGLTPRELEVLARIARGQGNRDIAVGLGIAEETVKTHVSNLLAKLRLADRTQAAVYALRRRLVPLDE